VDEGSHAGDCRHDEGPEALVHPCPERAWGPLRDYLNTLAGEAVARHPSLKVRLDCYATEAYPLRATAEFLTGHEERDLVFSIDVRREGASLILAADIGRDNGDVLAELAPAALDGDQGGVEGLGGLIVERVAPFFDTHSPLIDDSCAGYC
jgi:hypothetical protein